MKLAAIGPNAPDVSKAKGIKEKDGGIEPE
jgi:hypothetical protein